MPQCRSAWEGKGDAWTVHLANGKRTGKSSVWIATRKSMLQGKRIRKGVAAILGGDFDKLGKIGCLRNCVAEGIIESIKHWFYKELRTIGKGANVDGERFRWKLYGKSKVNLRDRFHALHWTSKKRHQNRQLHRFATPQTTHFSYFNKTIYLKSRLHPK